MQNQAKEDVFMACGNKSAIRYLRQNYDLRTLIKIDVFNDRVGRHCVTFYFHDVFEDRVVTIYGAFSFDFGNENRKALVKVLREAGFDPEKYSFIKVANNSANFTILK